MRREGEAGSEEQEAEIGSTVLRVRRLPLSRAKGVLLGCRDRSATLRRDRVPPLRRVRSIHAGILPRRQARVLTDATRGP